MLKLYLLIIALSIFPIDKNYGQEKDIEKYINKIKRYQKDSSVVKLCDTLFYVSEKNKRYSQASYALTKKILYYCMTSKIIDSVEKYKEECIKYTSRHGLYRDKYYAWNLYIMKMIKLYKHKESIIETQNMLASAKHDKYKIGIVYAYKNLAHIYELEGEREVSLNYIKKAISYIEEKNIKFKSTYSLYGFYIGKLLSNNRLLLAKEEIEKSKIYIKSKKDRNIYLKNLVKLHIKEKDLKKAKYYLNKLDSINWKNTYYTKSLKYVYYLEKYTIEKEYDKLIELSKSSKFLNNSIGNKLVKYENLAIAYSLKEKAKNTRQQYENLLLLKDSVNRDKQTKEINKLSTQLGLTHEQFKNQQLETEKHKLSIKILLIISVSIFLILLLMIYIYIKIRRQAKLERNLNYKLKQANAKIINEHIVEQSFFRKVNHELRTPLNSILGFSDIIYEKYKDNPETKKFVDIIRRNSELLTTLIENSLTVSEISDNKDIEKEDKISINSFCQEIVDKISHKCPERVDIIIYPIAHDIKIITYSNAIEEILNNLLDNAFKFTKKGNVKIKYKLHRNQIKFTISDTGIGIEKKKNPFENFYKTDIFSPGLGIGLSICQMAIIKVNGSISIDKKYTNGTKIHFSIPYKKVIED